MTPARFTIGGVSFDATSVNITQSARRDPIYCGGSIVGSTRGAYSFTVDAKGDEFEAFARMFDVFTLPASMDLMVTYASAEPELLRVPRDVEPTEEHGRTCIRYPLFHGPRLADGRWTRNEASR